MSQVTPNEIARRLGITGLQFRNWLRDQWRAGDPRFADHRINDRWSFSAELAAGLEAEYRTEQLDSRRPAPSRRSTPEPTPSPVSSQQAISTAPNRPLSAPVAGHRITVTVDGEEVETLEDLLRSGLLTVVVGINPAPVSVAAGHYWQGRTGATLWRRLRTVCLLPDEPDGFEDDAAFAAGVGFTDDELAAGYARLETKLTELDVPLVIFAFKKAATTLLGQFPGNGFIEGRALGSSRVFVMPGPYEASTSADRTLEMLAGWVKATRSDDRPAT